MSSILFAWVGQTDLNASKGEAEAASGPIAHVAELRDYERIVLLSNYPPQQAHEYEAWLSGRVTTPVEVRPVRLESPIDYAEIYRVASAVTEEVTAADGVSARLTFHLSPGTPAMAAIWIILAKTRYRDRCELVQTSRQRGVQSVDFPFDLYAEFVPELLRRSDDELLRLTQGLPPETPEFENIVHRCAAMKRALALARRLAARAALPVLIQGESGTGKELLARAIHSASRRREGPFVPVNCGAIPSELVDSELFGHRKGAFTGAIDDRRGVFEAASGGTLFLDEIGELAPSAQVRLLRALQEGKIRRVGESRERGIDVRVIAATHRDLIVEVAEGRFREDLFHRVAVGLLHLPPLRERKGDLSPLVDHLLEEINREARRSQPGYEEKKLTAAAKTLLSRQSWPGNVRELRNALLRASVWAVSPTIGEEEIRMSLLPEAPGRGDSVMRRPLGDGFDVNALLDEVRREYIERAMAEAHGKKTEAAKLLGLKSYQTLNQWMERLGVKPD